jgi:SAM-dependent methyltransferase
MTDEQLDVANRHIQFHAKKFNYQKSNVSFKKGNIEDLEIVGLADKSFDLVISNCVLNLVNDKQKVLNQVFRVLEEGGEFYFSDVYSDRRVPEALKEDPILYGECLSGALYWNDFVNMAKKAGFSDPRLVESRPLLINDKGIKQKLSGFNFYSATYRLFKLKDLEPACEDYGQAVSYKGGIEEEETAFVLDDHHIFEKGKILPVCGNTFDMLKKTRFQSYFQFYGDNKTHFGIYKDCGLTEPFVTESLQVSESSCC